MPTIDIYAPARLFLDVHRLASDAAAAVMAIEQVRPTSQCPDKLGALFREVPMEAISDVKWDSYHVRVQVLANAGRAIADRGDAGRLGVVGTRAHQPRTGEGRSRRNCKASDLQSAGLTSEPFEPLGGETIRMEAIWLAAPDSRKGRRFD